MSFIVHWRKDVSQCALHGKPSKYVTLRDAHVALRGSLC